MFEMVWSICVWIYRDIKQPVKNVQTNISGLQLAWKPEGYNLRSDNYLNVNMLLIHRKTKIKFTWYCSPTVLIQNGVMTLAYHTKIKYLPQNCLKRQSRWFIMYITLSIESYRKNKVI